MALMQLIPLTINLSMGLIVLCLGLNASMADALSLLRRPGLLVRSLLSMNVIMPVFAAIVALLFELNPAVEVALVALALSPVPPVLPGKQVKAGGTQSYAVGLLVAAAALAIVVVPAGIAIIDRIFGLTVTVPASRIASVVLMSVIAPLLIGLLLRQVAPALAKRVAHPVSLFATVLLVVAFLPVLISEWETIVAAVGNGTLIALAAFTLVGVAVGHLLGGPDPGGRSVLALATGTRHPGVALAIAGAAAADTKAVMAVVVWHLVVGAIVSAPYVSWRKRAHAAGAKT